MSNIPTQQYPIVQIIYHTHTILSNICMSEVLYVYQIMYCTGWNMGCVPKFKQMNIKLHYQSKYLLCHQIKTTMTYQSNRIIQEIACERMTVYSNP